MVDENLVAPAGAALVVGVAVCWTFMNRLHIVSSAIGATITAIFTLAGFLLKVALVIGMVGAAAWLLYAFTQ